MHIADASSHPPHITTPTPLASPACLLLHQFHHVPSHIVRLSGHHDDFPYLVDAGRVFPD
jgi:hypothetical protein